MRWRGLIASRTACTTPGAHASRFSFTFFEGKTTDLERAGFEVIRLSSTAVSRMFASVEQMLLP